MENPDPEFWKMVASDFPDHIKDWLKDGQPIPEVRHNSQGVVAEEEMEERLERVYRASQDPRIADCHLFGDGDREQLLAQLQTDYDLSKEDAVNAADIGMYGANEVADYGDEA